MIKSRDAKRDQLEFLAEIHDDEIAFHILEFIFNDWLNFYNKFAVYVLQLNIKLTLLLSGTAYVSIDEVFNIISGGIKFPSAFEVAVTRIVVDLCKSQSPEKFVVDLWKLFKKTE